jgi:hypothetical protein
MRFIPLATFIALISLLGLNHPKAKMTRLLFTNLKRCYVGVTLNQTWLSSQLRKRALKITKYSNCGKVISTDNKF